MSSFAVTSRAVSLLLDLLAARAVHTRADFQAALDRDPWGQVEGSG